ncbi:MAG: carbohydrate deacetylase [Phycisphaerae bacterium]
MHTGISTSHRSLIVNADDFGISSGTNLGIIRAHRYGVVTSASLMVLRPAARDAASYAADDSHLSVGLHVELGEWNFAQKQWRPVHASVNPRDAASVGEELHRQLKMFKELMGRPPTHLDSHQHVHMSAEMLPVFRSVAADLGVVLRSCHPAVQYRGAFFGADENMAPRPDLVSSANLIRSIEQIPVGITEFGVHPGLDMALDSEYRDVRPAEVQALCAPEVRKMIDDSGIILTSFAQIKPIWSQNEGPAAGRNP